MYRMVAGIAIRPPSSYGAPPRGAGDEPYRIRRAHRRAAAAGRTEPSSRESVTGSPPRAREDAWMDARSRLVRRARDAGSRAWPAVALAAVGCALGEAARAVSPAVALWPVGALLLGWFAGTGIRAGGGRPAGAERSVPGAVLAALLVLAVGWARKDPGAAVAAVLAGVALPLALAALLQRLGRTAAPRGIGSAEMRLIGAALIAAVPAALLRSDIVRTFAGLPPTGAGFTALLLGDLLAASIFAPLGAALARTTEPRRRDTDRAQGGEPTRAAGGLRGVGDALRSASVRTALVLIAASSALAVGLTFGGYPGLGRLAAIVHLAVGLWIARAVPQPAGALLVALNACAMGQLHGGWLDTVAVDGPGLHQQAATLMLLTGVFALQAILQVLSDGSREAARTLIRQAMRSDLSGLPNQRALARIVEHTLARPDRGAFWLVGVVLPDIARWSDLTDSTAATELERAVAGRLRATFEPLGARVAHPSSGRFVLTIGSRVDGIAIRQHLNRTLGGRRFEVSDQSIQLRFHAGMVEVPERAPVGADAVLASLSMALQRASTDPTGIHRVTASAELLDGYRTELRTVELVSRAIAEGRVRLFAERIEPARRAPGQASGLHYEILARVVDDDGQLIMPKVFLPAVWHAGLSSQLDRLVFVRTVAYLASQPRLLEATRLCSINVAGPTLCDPEFPEYVKRCLATHRVDPRKLMIEITESASISDLEIARGHVARLTRLGIGIALDDFGTGLATFDYLKRLRANVLKIDGSFVRAICSDRLDSEIVATVVRIARITGALTVAEWIETEEQRQVAVELGVDFLQGRLIAHPVPIETLLGASASGPRPARTAPATDPGATTVPFAYDRAHAAQPSAPTRPATPVTGAAAAR
jgi:EAL domain-containing protein (putative c-di-GMP-specific phosphodiesterase class I)/GGDEF domain-containing protein